MTLVLCLGNDLLRDDGVGWAVAEALDGNVPAGTIVRRSALSGFYLLDELVGYDLAIVVDAVRTRNHPPGTVLSFPFEALGSGDGPSPHAAGLPTVVRLGRQSGVALPSRIHIVAVEVDDMDTVGEGLTPRVTAAVPAAASAVRAALASLTKP
jgi:hydrogenase maturation protease